ncbi:MAG: nuclear transport factor 2 family protein [Sphingobacteriales bacterium]|nr:MAG: nuclear transport factor 2 family protein [Sphingobacteriales bacterium]
MKVYLFVLALLCSSFSGTAQKKSSQSAEAQIRALLQQQSEAWNRGDLEGYMRAGYATDDSLLFLGKTGATYGFDSTLARYRRGYQTPEAMGQLRFEILRIRLLGTDAAYVAGKWHLEKPVQPTGGAFLLILQKQAGRWRIVADHSS